MKQFTQQQLKFLKENFQQGQKAMQTGMFNRAEKHFLDVLKVGPDIIEAQNALAFVYVASKQHAKATAQLKIVLKTTPNHAQTHHNLANSLYEQQLYDEATSHYQTAIKLDPKLVESYIHCGITYRMQKNYETAIQYLHQALNLDKANAKAFHVLGMIYVDVEDYPRALECLENASGLAPKHAEFRVSFASVLEKASLDYEVGIQYHMACEIDPNYLDGFVLYGAYLQQQHRYDEAVECFQRAEQLAPQSLDVFDNLGNAYMGKNDTDAAINKFNASLNIDPNRISSLTGLVQTYQQAGKLDDAIGVCNRIIAINANEPTGYVLKSRAKKSKSDDGLAGQLLKFSAQENLDDANKIQVNYALGKTFDDQKDYKQAFKYYAEANALENKNNQKYNAKADEASFSKLIEVFNTGFFQQHQHLGVDSSLPIIIVGMPRSATTLTEQIISSHPKVIGAGEVGFWGRAPIAMPLRLNTETSYPECITEMLPQHAKDIAAMYESTLRKIAGADTNPVHITDKMPHNFLYLGLIALLFPNVKIIHTIRDPIDTCLSIFFHRFNESHPYASDLGSLALHYNQYQRIMRHWHTVLPGRIMDIHYADTISDPEYWTRKLISHVGLEWDDTCLAPHKLERSVRTFSNWQVRQPIYKTSNQRWKNYEEFLQPLIDALKYS